MYIGYKKLIVNSYITTKRRHTRNTYTIKD